MDVPAFTTEQRILTLVGDLGLDLRLDDAPDAEAAIDAAIESGTADVHFYVQGYDLTLLSLSTWVQVTATWFAVRYLCQRRLNDLPKTVELECERREKQLQMILERKADVPGVPKNRRPATVTNYHVDLRRNTAQIRVVRPKTTGVSPDYRRVLDNTVEDDR